RHLLDDVERVAAIATGVSVGGHGEASVPTPSLSADQPILMGRLARRRKGAYRSRSAERGGLMKVRKAVIPAAGLGTRFLPATKAQPKVMLPVIDVPAIQLVVEEAARAGIDDVLIVTGRGQRAIEDHFDRNLELERFLEDKAKFDELKRIRQISDVAEVHYIRQKEALGLG